MSLRQLTLAPLAALVASAVLAGTATADRIFVGDAQGNIHTADTEQGVFELFSSQASGPILAMSADRDRLYAIDNAGELHVLLRMNGALENSFVLPTGPAQAIAAANGSVFVGTESGIVARIDPHSGALLGARTAPAGVRVLLAHRGYLFAAGSDGAIYRAPVESGAFTYFTCFCFFDLKGLAAEQDKFVAVDASGFTGVIDLATGIITGGFMLPPTNAIALSEGSLFAHVGGGQISPYYLGGGVQLPGGFQSPTELSAMLFLRETSPMLSPRFSSPK